MDDWNILNIKHKTQHEKLCASSTHQQPTVKKKKLTRQKKKRRVKMSAFTQCVVFDVQPILVIDNLQAVKTMKPILLTGVQEAFLN